MVQSRTDGRTDRQTDRQKAMHMSPPCISTGVLKKNCDFLAKLTSGHVFIKIIVQGTIVNHKCDLQLEQCRTIYFLSILYSIVILYHIIFFHGKTSFQPCKIFTKLRETKIFFLWHIRLYTRFLLLVLVDPYNYLLQIDYIVTLVDKKMIQGSDPNSFLTILTFDLSGPLFLGSPSFWTPLSGRRFGLRTFSVIFLGGGLDFDLFGHISGRGFGLTIHY